MVPAIVLFVVSGVTRLAGWGFGVTAIDSWPDSLRLGLVAMFAFTALAHFVQPRRNGLIAMVPPRLPNASALVTVTGVLELAGAIGLLVPATAQLAAGCLAALLIVMFPANVRAARAGRGIKTMPLPLRSIVQIMFVGACLVVVFY